MDDTDHRFGRSITRLNKEAHRYFSQALAPFDLAPGMQSYLLILQPGVPQAQKEMSDLLLVDAANVTRALKNFESRGWITRHKSPVDSKEWLITLTHTGALVRQKVAEIAAVYTAILRQRLSGEQWEVLTNLLERASGPVANLHTTL